MRTGIRTDMTTLIVALRNFANSPKKGTFVDIFHHSSRDVVLGLQCFPHYDVKCSVNDVMSTLALLLKCSMIDSFESATYELLVSP